MAELQGRNALAGAAGAVAGEQAANILLEQMFPGKSAADLTEEQKQTISAFSTLAAGPAGGIAGDSSAGVLTGAQAGKNAAENNALASRDLGDCRTMSAEACGKAKELSQKILDKNLPSVEDMRDKLAACQDDSCKQTVWQEYRQASDKTIETLKQMALNGELSREELAFINHDLARELAFGGRVDNDKIGRSEYMSWLGGGSGPLSGFFNAELREKELVNQGFSPEDAAQKTKEDQRNMMLIETAMSVIGSKVSNKTNATNVTGGAKRAQQYLSNWPTGDLNAAIKKFAGNNPVITTTEKGKRIYTNPQTGIQVVEDTSGNYFRIYNPNASGKRAYLDLDGNIPNNKTLENGKQTGRSQGEYNEVTHFNIDRKK